MDRERWQKVDRIFESALGRPFGERAVFLGEACAGDEELRREVESLIAHDRAGSFMEKPASEDAARLIVKDGPPLVGQTIGAYKILKTLGAGGMGEVYLAHDTRLNRPAALKLLSAHLTTDEERVGRFRQEALAASALNHPNIITIYEIGNMGGRDFIATEFVDGVTLRGRMRGRRLRLADALDIALQIASALAAAHRAGIVHRDIKPENVMVRPDGLVKVLDFGIAKYAEPSHHRRDAKEALVKTTPGAVIGTVAYMSPEQARGLAVDARSDIWSLGVILYEMVSRRLPFTGATPTDRIAAILGREPEPLSKLRGISPELDRIVRRALAKDRDERYAQAADLAADLRKLRATLGGERASRFNLPTPAQTWYTFPPRLKMIAPVALFLVVTALIAAGLSYLRSGAGGAAIDSLAVLPLVNVSGTADTEYLSDGITESLINSLSRLSDLRVMARTTVFLYKGREADPQKVGRELGVRAVLTGKVLQRGDALIIQADLVNVADGSQLWGERYNRKLTDLVAVQNEIARDVSRKLRARLSGADEQKLTKDYTANVEAYQLYLKGRYHLVKLTPSEIQKGISYFQQAIEIDASYALAYVGLANAYRLLTLTGEMPSTKFFPKAKAAAQKAIEIDDTLAEAHAEFGFIISWYDWDWNAAEDQCKRALGLNPNSADAHFAYARLLSNTGRHEEGLAEIKRARELDPLNLRINAVEGEFLIYAGQADEALARLQKTFELDPNYWFAHMFAASAYIEKGMFTEAVAEARKARELSGVGTQPMAFGAYALAKSGKRVEARAALEELLRLSTERYVPPYPIAMIYNGLGERDEAIAWLERGYEQREPRMSFLKVEPKWNNLRSDPRFQDLMRRVGFTP